MNYATERVSERCQIKAKRQQRAKQGTIIEPLRGIFRTCLKQPFRIIVALLARSSKVIKLKVEWLTAFVEVL